MKIYKILIFLSLILFFLLFFNNSVFSDIWFHESLEFELIDSIPFDLDPQSLLEKTIRDIFYIDFIYDTNLVCTISQKKYNEDETVLSFKSSCENEFLKSSYFYFDINLESPDNFKNIFFNYTNHSIIIESQPQMAVFFEED